jgi:hypothetical protein
MSDVTLYIRKLPSAWDQGLASFSFSIILSLKFSDFDDIKIFCQLFNTMYKS